VDAAATRRLRRVGDVQEFAGGDSGISERLGVMYFLRRRSLLVRVARHHFQRIVRQGPLQRLCFVPRRAHPNIAFMVSRQMPSIEGIAAR
jgi:hypothetical protein